MSELNSGNIRVVTHLFKNTNVDPHHSIEVDVHLPPGKSSHLVTKTVIICYYILKQDALGKQKCLMVSKRRFAVMTKKKKRWQSGLIQLPLCPCTTQLTLACTPRAWVVRNRFRFVQIVSLLPFSARSLSLSFSISLSLR